MKATPLKPSPPTISACRSPNPRCATCCTRCFPPRPPAAFWPRSISSIRWPHRTPSTAPNAPPTSSSNCSTAGWPPAPRKTAASESRTSSPIRSRPHWRTWAKASAPWPISSPPRARASASSSMTPRRARNSAAPSTKSKSSVLSSRATWTASATWAPPSTPSSPSR